MSIFLIMRDRLKISVQGDETEAQRIMSSRRPVVVKRQSVDSPALLRTVIVRPRDILFAEVVSGQEELALQVQAAEAAKKNPKQGREPRLVTPAGQIVVPR